MSKGKEFPQKVWITFDSLGNPHNVYRGPGPFGDTTGYVSIEEHSHLLAEARREERRMIIDFCEAELDSFGEEKASEYGLGAKDMCRLIIREWAKAAEGASE